MMNWIYPSKILEQNHSNFLTVSSHNHQKVQIRDAWPNWTSIHDDHHRYKKKRNKKKCSYPCIIKSIIIGLLLLIISAILLVVLLTRSKNQTITINRTAVLRWNTTGETIAGVVGQFGNASNQLNVPFGLTMDWSNTLYIADWSNHRVQKYLRNSSFGQTVAGQATGSYNTTSSFLYYPGDVAVDWNSNVYVADTFNNRIQLWTNGSSSGMTVAGTGSIGNGSNELARPYALTRDPNTGTLYISDTFNNRVMCYLSGALSGSIVAGGLGSGTNNTQLSSPFGIYFDSLSNSLIIANGNANNIVRWTLGASSWTLLAGNANGMSGNTSTEFNIPMDVTLDPMGNMYVVERLNHRIQFFPMGETIGTTIAGLTGISGSNSMLLNQPMSVTLDSQLNLYVADTFNSRIQKFVRY
ncbi:unnamed protein product [Adineta steineri]|uniref:NHL repeat containing protein n=1 Tax=Adineta steineri TaxID=433720 RepID=A0A814BBJ4_9BILA|nr:unnamed protein product [Adineta steineri]CAF1106604.1 unnamed protein product [Adineta steineri]